MVGDTDHCLGTVCNPQITYVSVLKDWHNCKDTL